MPRPQPLTVTLPTIDSVPAAFRGRFFVLRSVLIDGESNTKLAKSNNSGLPYKSFGISLAPAKQSGYQMCSSSTEECRKLCLFWQGMAGLFPSVQAARIARTIALKEHPQWFLETLLYEMRKYSDAAKRGKLTLVVRPNVVSDVMFEKLFPSMFDLFPEVRLMDYTKHYKRMVRYCNGELPENYHLTFSRSEANDEQCRHILEAGGNVAVVFHKRLPDRWLGKRVVNGDKHDLRFLDPKGVVVGLLAKGTARTADSPFVVNTRRVPLVLVG